MALVPEEDQDEGGREGGCIRSSRGMPSRPTPQTKAKDARSLRTLSPSSSPGTTIATCGKAWPPTTWACTHDDTTPELLLLAWAKRRALTRTEALVASIFSTGYCSKRAMAAPFQLRRLSLELLGMEGGREGGKMSVVFKSVGGKEGWWGEGRK